jgi:hypothetical protein
MSIHIISFFSESDPYLGLHEIQDVAYFCSAFCMREALESIEREVGFRITPTNSADEIEFANGEGGVSYGAYPGGDETDYSVNCNTCAEHLWDGQK